MKWPFLDHGYETFRIRHHELIGLAEAELYWVVASVVRVVKRRLVWTQIHQQLPRPLVLQQQPLPGWKVRKSRTKMSREWKRGVCVSVSADLGQNLTTSPQCCHGNPYWEESWSSWPPWKTKTNQCVITLSETGLPMGSIFLSFLWIRALLSWYTSNSRQPRSQWRCVYLFKFLSKC